MRKSKGPVWGLVIILSISLILTADAQEPARPEAVYTGRDFRELTPALQTLYIAAVMDTILLSARWGARDDRANELQAAAACLRRGRMTPPEYRRLAEVYINNAQPEVLRLSAPEVLVNVLSALCPRIR